MSPSSGAHPRMFRAMPRPLHLSPHDDNDDGRRDGRPKASFSGWPSASKFPQESPICLQCVALWNLPSPSTHISWTSGLSAQIDLTPPPSEGAHSPALPSPASSTCPFLEGSLCVQGSDLQCKLIGELWAGRADQLPGPAESPAPLPREPVPTVAGRLMQRGPEAGKTPVLRGTGARAGQKGWQRGQPRAPETGKQVPTVCLHADSSSQLF